MEIGLDFETYSDVPIKQGLDRYMSSPDFRVLLGGVARESSPFGDPEVEESFDFATGHSAARDNALGKFRELIQNADIIVAHNAPFERGCLRALNIPEQWWEHKMRDSAVLARILGASSRLEFAAPQLLPVGTKMPEGKELIKMFSVPRHDGTARVDEWMKWQPGEGIALAWEKFIEYCIQDARLGLLLWRRYKQMAVGIEFSYENLTDEMNTAGWPVDLPLVHEMNSRYHDNLDDLLDDFRKQHDPRGELNFNSPKQLAEWCKERGILVKSLDQTHLPKVQKAVIKRAESLALGHPQFVKYSEILDMLSVKRSMGGSSLTKLQTIIDQTGSDGRLRGQYMHCGAGQTLRTSGRGVQMQNLKQLGEVVDDVDELMSRGVDRTWWSNTELAKNIRQVFKSDKPQGKIIVGDFKAVEARGLPWLADQEWTLEAFRQGKDLYKVMAARMYNTSYESVTKELRRAGKVGVLACGYGAGPKAVRSFAEKMGIDFTEREATSIVNDWREANTDIVDLWATLDRGLRDLLEGDSLVGEPIFYSLRDRTEVGFCKIPTPASLTSEVPNAQTVEMRLVHKGTTHLRRYFQGVHFDGKDICYAKPNETRSGKLWRTRWFKDGASGKFKLYGGKLTGILTQSLCRELFFSSMADLDNRLVNAPNAEIIGQFHDEIVVHWWPGVEENDVHVPLDTVIKAMELAMTDSELEDFPLDVSIGHAQRYIK